MQQGFSTDERRTLESVLDEIIPPSADGRLPGAGQIGLAADIDAALQKVPDLRAMIAQGLADLDAAARARNAGSFSALAKADKVHLLNEHGFVLPLAFQTYTAYYRHPQVLEALGMEPRAPHPEGYQMPPNDLSLLDAVRHRTKRYRAC